MKDLKLPKIDDLFEAGVHFGHQVRRWHPAMAKYIFTSKNDIHIIDLEQTEKCLEKACIFLYETAKKGGKIIFVGTKRQSRDIIELEAKRCGANYVTERWIGGTISNFKVIKKNIDKLLFKIKGRDDGSFVAKYTKKERLLIDREIEKLQKNVGGLVTLTDVPQVVFVIDPKREKTAVHESIISKVPVVALVDTNADPRGISYLIPGNDDAIKSTAIIVKALADAVELGFKEFYDVSTEQKEQKVEVKVEPKIVEPVKKVEPKVEVKSAHPAHKVEPKTESKEVKKVSKPKGGKK